MVNPLACCCKNQDLKNAFKHAGVMACMELWNEENTKYSIQLVKQWADVRASSKEKN